jgi:hypothetical protein
MAEIVSGPSPRTDAGTETVIVSGIVNGTGNASVIVIVTEIEIGIIESGTVSGIEIVIGTEREIGIGIGTASGGRARLGTRLGLEGKRISILIYPCD